MKLLILHFVSHNHWNLVNKKLAKFDLDLRYSFPMHQYLITVNVLRDLERNTYLYDVIKRLAH